MIGVACHAGALSVVVGVWNINDDVLGLIVDRSAFKGDGAGGIGGADW